MSFPPVISNWDTYLKGLTPCRFPRFSRANHTAASPQQTSSLRVYVEQADKLLGLSAKDPEELGAVLSTAWALLLRSYTGQDDVCFSFQHGSDVASGPVVVRFLLDDGASVAGTLGRAKAELAGDLPPVSTELLRSGDSDRPFFDTAVVLCELSQGSAPCPVLEPVRTFSFSPEQPLTVANPNPATILTPANTQQQQHKLRLVAKRGEDSLDLFLEWDSSLLGMPEAQGMLVASTLDKILSGLLLTPPDAPLSSLDILSQANLDRVCQWNASYPIDPVERCVHDVIADQVLAQPDAEAVCSWDGSLTYRELDAVSCRLAVKLVGLGVGPEILVPVCFEKSVCDVIFFASLKVD
jgi:hypothetical protein